MRVRTIGATMTSTESPPRPRVVQTLRRVHQLMQLTADRVAREHGLTMQQWELLARLRRAEAPVDHRQLGCALHVTPPTLTALVDTAVERGLVERREHPDDRRRRLVALTEAGEGRLAATPHVGRMVAQRMLAGFSREEREQLGALLERAANNLEASR
jgi:MarR family transcriptional regulator, transcriptional regulator for hemolysin